MQRLSKRPLAAAIAIALAAGTLAFSPIFLPTADAAAVNLLSVNQQSIEAEPAGWVADPVAKSWRSTQAASSGSSSLLVAAVAASFDGDQPMKVSTARGRNGVRVTPGTAYRGRVDVRAQQRVSPTACHLLWFSADGVYMGRSVGPWTSDATSAWTTLRCTGVAPARAAYAALQVNVQTARSGDVHFVDRAALMGPRTDSDPTSSTSTTGSTTTGPTTTVAPTTTTIAPTTTTTAAPTTTTTAPTTTTTTPPSPDDPSVSFVGDSNMSNSEGWIRQIAGPSFDIEVIARGGAGVDIPSDYWTTALAGLDSARVVVNLGINDTYAVPADYPARIDRFMTMIGSRPVVWTNLPCDVEPVSFRTNCRVVNQHIAAARARWSNLVVLDWATLANRHPEYFVSGDVHLNQAGQQAWATLVTNYLRA